MQITARDIMTGNPALLSNLATISDAEQAMTDRHCTQLFVVDSTGAFLGMLFDYTLLKERILGAENNRTIDNLISQPEVILTASQPVQEMILFFREARHARLPVMENGQLVGHVDRTDIMRLMMTLEAVEESLTNATSALQPNEAIRGPKYHTRQQRAMSEQK